MQAPGEKVNPFANLPEPKDARCGKALTLEMMKTRRGAKPAPMANVKFTEITTARHLWYSRFMGPRDDKDPRSFVLETGGEWKS